jgi:hypothetical protein
LYGYVCLFIKLYLFFKIGYLFVSGVDYLLVLGDLLDGDGVLFVVVIL